VGKGLLGVLLSASALVVIDFGKSVWFWVGKLFLLVGLLCLSCAFPVGVYTVQNYATFLPCMILQLGSIVSMILSVLVFFWIPESQEEEEERALLVVLP
jgi:hypothetical protein